MTIRTNGSTAQGIGHNGGPQLDDAIKQRIEERLKRDKYTWRDEMDGLRLEELNAWLKDSLDLLGGEERAKLPVHMPAKLTRAQAESLKRLYAKLCNYMSHDPDNDPGEAWPTQAQLADALGWRERTIRDYMPVLRVLGLVWTHRTKRRPAQCVTRNHYRLRPPSIRESNRRHVCR